MHFQKKNFYLGAILLSLIYFPRSSAAQSTGNKIQDFFNSNSASLQRLSDINETKEFYVRNQFTYYWLSEKNKVNLQILINDLNLAEGLGLEPNDYLIPNFNRTDNTLSPPSGNEDSVLTDIMITDIAIHFFHDVAVGNKPEDLSYNGLNYTPDCLNIDEMLFGYLHAGKLALLLNDLQPQEKIFVSLKKKLQFFQQMIATGGFKDAAVVITSMDPGTGPLVKRLYQLGFLASDTMTLDAQQLKSTMMEVQNTFNEVADGELRHSTLDMLNVPLATRIQELKNAINAVRWFSCIKKSEKHIIIVNIPSTNLLLYDYDNVIMESKIIAGKKTTPTPTLCSKINEVILFTYWNVPNKIATSELLPLIKKNSKFLEDNNYEVMDRQANIIDPATIEWRKLSKNNFPYKIRQSTGCDNSLGLVKLNFYNPFDIYLHDTPFKSLFNLKNRFFSHGCVRVEKAFDVARYVLGNKSVAIDTLVQGDCPSNQEPVPVRASEIIPVFIIYHTAWVDSDSAVRFYPDIYRKFSPPKN